MNNLLFFGTTNYGINLSESDKLKFKELEQWIQKYVTSIN